MTGTMSLLYDWDDKVVISLGRLTRYVTGKISPLCHWVDKPVTSPGRLARYITGTISPLHYCVDARLIAQRMAMGGSGSLSPKFPCNLAAFMVIERPPIDWHSKDWNSLEIRLL